LQSQSNIYERRTWKEILVIPTVKVAIVKGQSPKAMVRRSLDLIGANELIASDDRVLIKPNYICAKHPWT